MPKREDIEPTDSAAYEKAAEWLIEQDEGFSPEREAAFYAWCAANPEHEAAIRELRQSWKRVNDISAKFRVYSRAADPDIIPGRNLRNRRIVQWFVYGLAAASILVLASIGWIRSDQRQEVEGLYATYAFDFSRLNLADDSILELNSNSKARVMYSEDVRMVELVDGEAHFQVKSDQSRPFIVKVNNLTIKALGTAFNIRIVSDTVEVLVTEGNVSVSQIESRPQAVVEPGKFLSSKATQVIPVLSSSQQAVLSDETDSGIAEVATLHDDEISRILAWKGPRLFFDATPLSEALRQFNSYNDVNVVIHDAELESLQVGGSFLIDDLDTFLRLLSSHGQIDVDRENEHLVSIRRKPQEVR